MRVEDGIKLDFKDVLFKPKRSSLNSRSDVDLVNEIICPHSGVKITGVPIISANMDTTGTFSMAKKLSQNKMYTAIHKHYSLEDWKRFLSTPITNGFVDLKDLHMDYSKVFVSSGTSEKDLEKLNNILSMSDKLKMICVDVANGYSEHFVKAIEKIRHDHPDKFIMGGNVVTPEMTEELIIQGVSCVKVGIGPGSVCTTRRMTGVGMPQLSAIIECAEAAHGLKGNICADGGCTTPGDVSKAFGGGADFVMLGGMFSGYKENEAEIIVEDGEKFVEFYGMSSKKAMNQYSGGVANYRASEGKVVKIPFKGNIEDGLQDILGGLRSTCTYVGAKRLKDLTKRTTFVRVTQQINEVYGKAD